MGVLIDIDEFVLAYEEVHKLRFFVESILSGLHFLNPVAEISGAFVGEHFYHLTEKFVVDLRLLRLFNLLLGLVYDFLLSLKLGFSLFECDLQKL